MTVEEQLVCFRGWCFFKKYIPSKQGKYGIKIWTICDSTCSYTWKMQVYTGKDAGSAREANPTVRLFLIWQKILKILAEISSVIISSQICGLHENFLKEAHTGRNNEEEQTRAPNEI